MGQPQPLEKEHRNRFEPEPDAAETEAKRLARLITVTQKKDVASLTAVHSASIEAVDPAVITSPPATFRFTEIKLNAEIHEFLFEVRKGGRVFWIGASVPKNTKDFTRAQMFFAPSTVKPDGRGGVIVLADDKDYLEFKGGWASRMRNFISMMGVQAAAVQRPVTLLCPFMKAAAFGALNEQNVFKDRPVDTLNAVMTAIQRHVAGNKSSASLAKLGVSSFSSGVTPMRLCLNALSKSSLVKEVFNFDGPFLSAEPKTLTFSPGAVAKVFTQSQLPQPPIGWVNLLPEHFKNVVTTFGQTNPQNIMHQRIGKMMYFQALKNSFV